MTTTTRRKLQREAYYATLAVCCDCPKCGGKDRCYREIGGRKSCLLAGRKGQALVCCLDCSTEYLKPCN